MASNSEKPPLRVTLAHDHSTLSLAVQQLLSDMQSRLDHIGTNVLSRMDTMSQQMDELERSVSDLMNQVGVEKAVPSPSLVRPHRVLQPGSGRAVTTGSISSNGTIHSSLINRRPVAVEDSDDSEGRDFPRFTSTSVEI